MFEDFVSEIDFPFTMLPTKVWDVGLTTSELAVLSRIIFRAGIKGQCFESRASIAEACSLTERTVGTVFAELERLQVVTIVRRRAEMKPNLIKINSPAQWMSKRKNFPKEDHPQETISQPLRKSFPDPQENISYGTRSNELDQIKLDSFNTVAAAQPTASQELVPLEVVTAKKPKTKTEETWRAYQDGYKVRYGVEPLRNAKVNAQLKQFCERVGYEDAPELMKFYLSINDFWYVKQMHTVGIALADAEKIVAAYRRGSFVTKREAEYIDKTSSRKSFIEQIYDARDSQE